LFLLGVFARTLVRNVPLNDALAPVDPQGGAGSAVCAHYYGPDPVEPNARVAGTAATVLLVLSLRAPIV
jgi:uncharacterized membrane protein